MFLGQHRFNESTTRRESSRILKRSLSPKSFAEKYEQIYFLLKSSANKTLDHKTN
jgi:hypothetical protein